MNLPLALIALLPMITGPLPQSDEAQRTLTMTLCGGGEITIPIGGEEEAPPLGDCHKHACHSGSCRKKANTAD